MPSSARALPSADSLFMPCRWTRQRPGALRRPSVWPTAKPRRRRNSFPPRMSNHPLGGSKSVRRFLRDGAWAFSFNSSKVIDRRGRCPHRPVPSLPLIVSSCPAAGRGSVPVLCAVRVFGRRPNLAAGGIHFRRGCQIIPWGAQKAHGAFGGMGHGLFLLIHRRS